MTTTAGTWRELAYHHRHGMDLWLFGRLAMRHLPSGLAYASPEQIAACDRGRDLWLAAMGVLRMRGADASRWRALPEADQDEVLDALRLRGLLGRYGRKDHDGRGRTVGQVLAARLAYSELRRQAATTADGVGHERV